MMKAYIVREKDEFAAAVVFAETPGKAKTLALRTDACEGSDFLNIEVRRIKEADKYYKPGKQELDWFNQEDRIAMVSHQLGVNLLCHAMTEKDYAGLPLLVARFPDIRTMANHLKSYGAALTVHTMLVQSYMALFAALDLIWGMNVSLLTL